MSVRPAINRANAVWAGTPAASGKHDRRRWKAVILVGEYIESDPEEVWQFVRRRGSHRQKDLRDAIACCLLEHLLEYHFELIFPRVEEATKKSKLFADTFTRCWKFGQTKVPKNSRKFDRLLAWCLKRQEPVKRTRTRARRKRGG
jgi:hypothetical protein